MSKKGFAAVIAGFEKLHSRLDQADVLIAQALLDSTVDDYPQPAWNTGMLRNSGAAYVGSTLVSTTAGRYDVNPLTGGTQPGAEVGNATTLQSLRVRKFAGHPNVPDTVRGRISIVYTAPVAADMHEWDGFFSHPTSGPAYITAKLATFYGNYISIMQELTR